MESDSKNNLQLEIGYVLFLDIVGYSKLLIEEQKERLDQLTKIVLGTPQVRDSTDEQLVRLPTGDGMALVFHHSAEEPARCALEIAEVLRKHPEIPVRMGIHSGPVSEVTDVSGRKNIAGAGINLAQRVMDCGDAGHILLSQHVADDLVQYRQWAPRLHDLGECEVKHGVRLHLVNLYAEPLGNAALPQKFQDSAEKQAAAKAVVGTPARSSSLGKRVAIAAVVILAAGAVYYFTSQRTPPPAATQEAPKTAPIPEKSIAVLPFENLSSDKENAYFADGVQDEILSNLAKIDDLKVISRTSAMQYKTGTQRNLREIGQQLGVAHLLEGSVQRAAGKVRVNAQLIDARSDAHQWAQVYDRPLDDVFAIQSEIARTIAEQLQARLSPDERAEIAKPPTTDPLAYDLYLRARQLDDMANDPNAKGSLLRGISLLEEAVRRDPKFLRAYSLLCETHMDLYWAGLDHTEARREMARAAIQKAEEIQPDAGDLHYMKGVYAYRGFRDYEGALKELEQAKRLLPNDARVYLLAAAVDRRSGHLPDAEAAFQRAAELDPRNFVVLLEAGTTFAATRRYAEAQSLYDRALSVQPNDPFASYMLGFSRIARTGDAAALRKPLDAVAQQSPEAARSVAFPLLLCSWMERNKSEAEKALTLIPAEGISNSFDEASIPRAYCVGRTARLFGDTEQARSALTEARAIFERQTVEQPEYAQAWTYLGLTDAMLGRSDDAIREGKRACEILPISKDSWVGSLWITNLAMIYAWAGQKDAALQQLQVCINLPVGLTYGELKQGQDWDALRGDPRFEKIVADFAPK